MKLQYLFSLIFLPLSFFLNTLSSEANILVLNGLTHELEAESGGHYKDRIEIQNNGTEEKSVKVYLRDYWYSYSGESRHDDPGTLERSNAAWISYSPQLLTLQPNEKTFIDFEINIPQNDSLEGSYWSVIMVEGIVPPDTVASTHGVKINTAVRYAVQVITNIGDMGKKDLQFVGLELVNNGQNNLLNVAVENIGESILKPEMSVEVFDENGNSQGVFKADRKKTLPGTSIKVSLVLEGIKPGSYSAILVADCDEEHIYGTNISIEI